MTENNEKETTKMKYTSEVQTTINRAPQNVARRAFRLAIAAMASGLWGRQTTTMTGPLPDFLSRGMRMQDYGAIARKRRVSKYVRTVRNTRNSHVVRLAK